MRKYIFDDPVKQAHYEDILKYPQQYAICIDAQYYDPDRREWVPIDKKQIIQNTTKFSMQCSDTTDITIGGVYIGTAEFTMDFSVPEPENGFLNKLIFIFFMYFDPTVDYYNQPEGFPFPIFKHAYYVQDATDSNNGRTLKLVDNMAYFDKKLPLSYSPSGSLYTILQRICENCKVALGMTQAEVEALPNGDEVWGYYPENDCQTYRDVLHWISQACCGFCYYDQYKGGLVIKSYNAPLEYDALSATERIDGANIAAYATQITAAAFTNADGSIETIGSPTLGRTYDMGFNPFLIYGQRVTLERMRTAIFNVLYSMRFKPFTAKVIIPPIYDLGDKLLFSGGHMRSDGYYSCIQKIDWSQQGLQIQGFGKNPTVASKDASTSRAVSQATKASEMVIKREGNYNAIHVGSSEAIVSQIDFSALRAGVDVEMWHEFLCDVTVNSSPMTVTAYYYLDGVLLDRRPIETISESGEHILDLHYSDSIQEAGLHRWIVKLMCDGGSIDFDQYDCLSVLKGQGLEKEVRWTGLIVCSDIVEAFELPNVFTTIEDVCVASLQDILRSQNADTVQPIGTEMILDSLNENKRITLLYGDHILRCGRGDRCGLGRTFGGLT